MQTITTCSKCTDPCLCKFVTLSLQRYIDRQFEFYCNCRLLNILLFPIAVCQWNYSSGFSQPAWRSPAKLLLQTAKAGYEIAKTIFFHTPTWSLAETCPLTVLCVSNWQVLKEVRQPSSGAPIYSEVQQEGQTQRDERNGEQKATAFYFKIYFFYIPSLHSSTPFLLLEH